MKKNIAILSIALMLLGIYFSFNLFDDLSFNRAAAYYRAYNINQHASDAFEMGESNDTRDISAKEFNSALNQAAVGNNIVIMILDIGNDSSTGVNTTRIYLSSNDIYLKDWLLIDEGYASVNDGKTIYSSASKDRSTRITSFKIDFVFEVLPLESYELKTGYYNIFNLEGDFQHNFDSFIATMNKQVGELSYFQSTTHMFHGDSDFEYMDSMFYNIGLKIIAALILLLLLCSKVFSLSRLVSVYKIEGHSAFSIYNKVFLRCFIISNLICITGVIILCFIICGSNMNTFLCLTQLILIQYFQIAVIAGVLSLLIYLIIRYMPIGESIKGKDKMQEIQGLAYVIKVVIVLLAIPLIYPSMMDLKNYTTIQIRRNSVEEKLENWHTFGFYKVSQAYDLDIGKDNYIALRDELAKTNHLQAFGKSFHIGDFDKFDPNNKDEFYSISKEYIVENNLIEGNEWTEAICVFTFKDTVESNEEIKDKMLRYVPPDLSLEVKFYRLDQAVNTLSISDLIYQDKVDTDLYMAYVPVEKRFDGQLNGSFFYFEGNATEAETFIDQVFNRYGYESAFRIESLKSTFNNFASTMSNIHFKGIVELLAILLAYFLANKFLLETDIDNNRKRYEIARIEGIAPYRFWTYILKIGSCAAISLILCFLSNRISIGYELFYAIGAIVIIETVFYGVFVYKYRKVERGIR